MTDPWDDWYIHLHLVHFYGFHDVGEYTNRPMDPGSMGRWRVISDPREATSLPKGSTEVGGTDIQKPRQVLTAGVKRTGIIYVRKFLLGTITDPIDFGTFESMIFRTF